MSTTEPFNNLHYIVPSSFYTWSVTEGVQYYIMLLLCLTSLFENTCLFFNLTLILVENFKYIHINLFLIVLISFFPRIDLEKMGFQKCPRIIQRYWGGFRMFIFKSYCHQMCMSNPTNIQYIQ